MKKKSFSIKIEYLFKKLELEEEAFTKLFWDEKSQHSIHEKSQL